MKSTGAMKIREKIEPRKKPENYNVYTHTCLSADIYN